MGWGGVPRPGQRLPHREPLWSRVNQPLPDRDRDRAGVRGGAPGLTREEDPPSLVRRPGQGPGPLVGFHPHLRPLSSELQAWEPTLSRAASGVSPTRRSSLVIMSPLSSGHSLRWVRGQRARGRHSAQIPRAARSPGRPGPACARTWVHSVPEGASPPQRSHRPATCTCGLSPQRALFPASHSGSLCSSPHLGPGPGRPNALCGHPTNMYCGPTGVGHRSH